MENRAVSSPLFPAHVGNDEDGRLIWTGLPDEQTWRIDRLRRRTGSTADGDTTSRSIRTLGDFLALRRERPRRKDAFERPLTSSKEKR